MRKYILIGLIALGGCVPQNFVKPGGTSEGFETDKQQCIYEVQLHQGADPLMWPMYVKQCLRARGWVRG